MSESDAFDVVVEGAPGYATFGLFNPPIETGVKIGAMAGLVVKAAERWGSNAGLLVVEWSCLPFMVGGVGCGPVGE